MLNGFFGSSGRAESARHNSRFPAFVEVEAYWEALRKSDGLPERTNLDPRGMRNALTKAFILERADPYQFRFRIVGSDISALHNRDLHGKALIELISESNREMVISIIRDLVELPAKATLDFSMQSELGADIDLRMGLFPMTDAQGQNTRILGCLDFAAALQPMQGGGLVLKGSVVRPLRRGQKPVERRRHHQSLKLVSSNDMPTKLRRQRSDAPKLTLVDL